jgi:hypothetical protein
VAKRGEWVPADGLTTPPLFEDVGPVVRKGNETRQSADARRHRKQEVAAEHGVHPLTGGPLHDEAPHGFAHERHAPFTCGTCEWRRQVGKAPKCTNWMEQYATPSPTTTVLAEFPACPRYERFGSA